jgi:two-component system, NarL family, sensor histidine kinase UhpB
VNVSVQHLAADTIARLLLVEDNPGDADFIGELLDDVSCEITKAVTLAEATGILQDAAFDAVLLDLNLPDGEGAACVETILAASPRVPRWSC